MVITTPGFAIMSSGEKLPKGKSKKAAPKANSTKGKTFFYVCYEIRYQIMNLEPTGK